MANGSIKCRGLKKPKRLPNQSSVSLAAGIHTSSFGCFKEPCGYPCNWIWYWTCCRKPLLGLQLLSQLEWLLLFWFGRWSSSDCTLLGDGWAFLDNLLLRNVLNCNVAAFGTSRIVEELCYEMLNSKKAKVRRGLFILLVVHIQNRFQRCILQGLVVNWSSDRLKKQRTRPN